MAVLRRLGLCLAFKMDEVILSGGSMRDAPFAAQMSLAGRLLLGGHE